MPRITQKFLVLDVHASDEQDFRHMRLNHQFLLYKRSPDIFVSNPKKANSFSIRNSPLK